MKSRRLSETVKPVSVPKKGQQAGKIKRSQPAVQNIKPLIAFTAGLMLPFDL